jgi:hypothetical protein
LRYYLALGPEWKRVDRALQAVLIVAFQDNASCQSCLGEAVNFDISPNFNVLPMST